MAKQLCSLRGYEGTPASLSKHLPDCSANMAYQLSQRKKPSCFLIQIQLQMRQDRKLDQ